MSEVKLLKPTRRPPLHGQSRRQHNSCCSQGCCALPSCSRVCVQLLPAWQGPPREDVSRGSCLQLSLCVHLGLLELGTAHSKQDRHKNSSCSVRTPGPTAERGLSPSACVTTGPPSQGSAEKGAREMCRPVYLLKYDMYKHIICLKEWIT